MAALPPLHALSLEQDETAADIASKRDFDLLKEMEDALMGGGDDEDDDDEAKKQKVDDDDDDDDEDDDDEWEDAVPAPWCAPQPQGQDDTVVPLQQPPAPAPVPAPEPAPEPAPVVPAPAPAPAPEPAGPSGVCVPVPDTPQAKALQTALEKGNAQLPRTKKCFAKVTLPIRLFLPAFNNWIPRNSGTNRTEDVGPGWSQILPGVLPEKERRDLPTKMRWVFANLGLGTDVHVQFETTYSANAPTKARTYRNQTIVSFNNFPTFESIDRVWGTIKGFLQQHYQDLVLGYSVE